MKTTLEIIKVNSFQSVRKTISLLLMQHNELLPTLKDGLILLKPNLNSNMNALTGNTTDLRILGALIQVLKEMGYSNILIGEGTNSGFYRNKIGVISRLKIDRLAERYNVKVKDLNYADPHEIYFDNGVKASVAREVMDAELFINIPTLKTHFENGMTVCLKNLMGCLIGQENKKKVHDNLAENILRLNRYVRPHLHIVDGLIAMEGLGPTRGTPLRMDMIIAGTDPYLIDLACARLAMFDYRRVRTLSLAEKKGLITPDHHYFLDHIDITDFQKPFAPPDAGLLATYIHDPKRQKFFLKIRNTSFFSYLASTDWFGDLLFRTGLRQDVFLKKEMDCQGLSCDENQCDSCGVCSDVCPMGLDLPHYLNKIDENCIFCLYCYSACPRRAIVFRGDFGFFHEQIKQYGAIIRQMYL